MIIPAFSTRYEGDSFFLALVLVIWSTRHWQGHRDRHLGDEFSLQIVLLMDQVDLVVDGRLLPAQGRGHENHDGRYGDNSHIPVEP